MALASAIINIDTRCSDSGNLGIKEKDPPFLMLTTVLFLNHDVACIHLKTFVRKLSFSECFLCDLNRFGTADTCLRRVYLRK